MKYQDLPDPMYDDQRSLIEAVTDLDAFREQHDQALARRDRLNDYYDTPAQALEKTSEGHEAGPGASRAGRPANPSTADNGRPAASALPLTSSRASGGPSTRMGGRSWDNPDSVVSLSQRRLPASPDASAGPPPSNPPEAA